jgi:hypothetical protein
MKQKEEEEEEKEWEPEPILSCAYLKKDSDDFIISADGLFKG